MKKSGFTLIELIVVITILAILGTIAFISFKGYTGDAKNSKMMTDVSNLDKSLSIHLVENGVVPVPDDSVKIKDGAFDVTMQGDMGANALSVLGQGVEFKDTEGNNYLYSVDSNYKKFQVTAFLNNDSASFGTLASANYENKTSYSEGDDVGYILTDDKNKLTSDLDIKTATGNYTVITEVGDTLLSGSELSHFRIDFNDFLLSDWDMTTKTIDGKLKDMTGKGNDGTIFGNPSLSNGNMIFDGVDDYVKLDNLDLSSHNKITLFTRVKFDYKDMSSCDRTNHSDCYDKLNSIAELSDNFNGSDGGFVLSSYDNSNRLTNGFYAISGGMHTSGGYSIDSTQQDTISGKWYNIALKMDLSKEKNKSILYVNGKKYQTNYLDAIEETNFAFGSYPFYIGGRVSQDLYLKGKMDKMKLFTTNLSEKAILELSK